MDTTTVERCDQKVTAPVLYVLYAVNGKGTRALKGAGRSQYNSVAEVLLILRFCVFNPK